MIQNTRWGSDGLSRATSRGCRPSRRLRSGRGVRCAHGGVPSGALNLACDFRDNLPINTKIGRQVLVQRFGRAAREIESTRSISKVRSMVMRVSRMMTAVLRQSSLDEAKRARDASIRERWSTGLGAAYIAFIPTLSHHPKHAASRIGGFTTLDNALRSSAIRNGLQICGRWAYSRGKEFAP